MLNGTFLLLLSGLSYYTHRRVKSGRPIEPVRAAEIPVIGAATFSLAKLIAREKVGTWMREPFVDESADHRPLRPSGRGLRYAIGELLTCSRCVGAWSALGLTALRIVNPPISRLVSTVLAINAVNDFMQAAFAWVCDSANRVVRPE